jgi:ABC-type lipoprotein release transport system permease subunit
VRQEDIEMLSLKLGLRNAGRRKWRSALTVVMLAFGTFLLSFSTALNEGPYADMTEMATGTWGGHLQVQHAGYFESPSMFEHIDDPRALVDALQARDDVTAATARLEAAGLLSVGERTAGTQLTGVMPANEQEVSTLTRTVTKGAFLPTGELGEEDPLPIVLGDGLAARLKAEVGDEVVFLGQAADGSMAAELFTLVGVLDSGVDTLDAAMALVRLQDAQELFEMKGRAHRIVVRAEDLARVDRIGRDFDVEAETAKLYTWKELNPSMVATIEGDRAGGFVFALVLMFMVALGAVNTTVMSVFERSKELGVMKALGTSPGTIIATVVWESFVIGVVGVGLGALLAAGLVEYVGQPHVGLEMLDEPVDFAGYQLFKIFPKNTIRGSVAYPAMILAATTLGAVWPAVRASLLDPVKAIRGV